jgi:hypothetical protein
MAIKLNGVIGQKIYTTSGVPTGNFTIFGRFCRTRDTVDYATLIALTNAGGNLYCFQTDITGVDKLATFDYDASVGSSSTPSYMSRPMEANVWYDAALVKSGTTLKAYFGSASDANLTVSQMTTFNFTPNEIAFGETPSGEPFDGKIADIKIHNSIAFNDNQIETLRRSILPASNVNVTHWYPMMNETLANCLLDYTRNYANLITTTQFTVVDGPPVPFGASPMVFNSSNVEYYGHGYPLVNSFSGNSSVVTIPMQICRVGETQLISLAYGITTGLSSYPTGWNVLVDQSLGKTRRVDLSRAEPDGNAQTTVNITLPATVPWVAHVTSTIGKISTVDTFETTTANTFQMPTIQADVGNVMWLSVISNTTGNAKYFSSNGNSVVELAYAAGSNTTTGVGMVVAGSYVPSAATLNYDNTWFIYDVTTSNANVIAPVTLRNFDGHTKYQSVILNNPQADVTTELGPTKLISKADTANVLNYNSEYTVLFDYYHVTGATGSANLDQVLWTLCNKFGYLDSTNNWALFDSIEVNANNTISVKVGDRYTGSATAGQEATSSQTIASNKWYTIGVSRINRGSSNCYLHGYVNGTLVASVGITGSTTPFSRTQRTIQPSAYMVMGGMQTNASSTAQRKYTAHKVVKGGYANLREWNVALSADEITSEVGRLYPITRRANLFAHYPMIGNNVSQLAQDVIGSRHLQITSNTITATNFVPEEVCGPVLAHDAAIAVSYIIQPPTLRRGLYMVDGNIVMIPIGSEKTSNVITINGAGTIATSNVRQNDYYFNFPSGRAVIFDSSTFTGNVNTINPSLDILIR